jgi:diguanylate cyclase (GGDEF)-like protein
LDSLTGLRNRRWLDDMFARQIARSLHTQQPASLLMIDVDGFKNFNDEHGHLTGDGVLRSIAQTLNVHVRPQDLLARYGGEEFLLLLPNTVMEGALVVAERLRHAVDQAGADRAPLPPATVSIGVAALSGGMSLTELMALADAALYRAKQAGRNCVSC